MSQEKNAKPQTPRFHLTHPCFELCRNSSPSYRVHFRKPALDECPKKKTQNLRPQDFISHIPVWNSARTPLQVSPRIICLEYHACRNQTQPLISAKPCAMAQKNKGINIGIHVFWPCLLMSFDVFPCTQLYSNRCKYIQIYSNILSTNPDTHLANARERCWRQHRNKVKTARPGE